MGVTRLGPWIGKPHPDLINGLRAEVGQQIECIADPEVNVGDVVGIEQRGEMRHRCFVGLAGDHHRWRINRRHGGSGLALATPNLDDEPLGGYHRQREQVLRDQVIERTLTGGRHAPLTSAKGVATAHWPLVTGAGHGHEGYRPKPMCSIRFAS